MKKTFDAVNTMREIRTRLAREYATHPETEMRSLEAIRRKHHIAPTTLLYTIRPWLKSMRTTISAHVVE